MYITRTFFTLLGKSPLTSICFTTFWKKSQVSLPTQPNFLVFSIIANTRKFIKIFEKYEFKVHHNYNVYTSTVYSVHSVQCTMYSVYCILYTAQIVHFTMHTYIYALSNISGILVTIIYVIVNLAYHTIMPTEELKRSQSIAVVSTTFLEVAP